MFHFEGRIEVGIDLDFPLQPRQVNRRLRKGEIPLPVPIDLFLDRRLPAR